MSNIDWEARRVTAAFGVEEWIWDYNLDKCIQASKGDTHFFFKFNAAGQWSILSIGNDANFSDECEVGIFETGALGVYCYEADNALYNELMARGLYRLGFTDQSVLSQLPELSAHEQLELRLDFPREFWPAAWIEEEASHV